VPKNSAAMRFAGCMSYLDLKWEHESTTGDPGPGDVCCTAALKAREE
jgi:hypothetical protein